MGEITVAGLKKVHDGVVRRRLSVRKGDLYSAAKVEQARKDLLALGVFAAVSVQLPNAPDINGQVPITFRVRERPRRAASVNADYSADLGGSGGVIWSNRNLLGNAVYVSSRTSSPESGVPARWGGGDIRSFAFLID